MGAFVSLSASDRHIVEVIIRHVAKVENTCGADAANIMLGDLERALLLRDE